MPGFCSLSQIYACSLLQMAYHDEWAKEFQSLRILRKSNPLVPVHILHNKQYHITGVTLLDDEQLIPQLVEF